MDDKSQIKACESSPAVQMWHELCGAQAKAFTEAWCRCSSATGRVGNLHAMPAEGGLSTKGTPIDSSFALMSADKT